MEQTRKKISNLTIKLQLQTRVPLWSITNEFLIYSIANEQKVEWSLKKKFLRTFLKATYRLSIADFFICVFGLYKALCIWLKLRKIVSKKPNLISYKKIFAGFGGSSDDDLYNDCVNQSKNIQILRINWVTYEGFDKLECPTLSSIFRNIKINAFGHTKKLKQSMHEISDHLLDFLLVCTLNIGAYAFYKAYWKKVKAKNIQEVIFTTPDILAFACVEEKLNTTYLQHGLLSLSILFPHFTKMYVITEEERRYLKSYIKNIDILKMQTEIKNKSEKNNILMLLSINVSQNERLSNAKPIIDWALNKDLKVIIRPTRKVTKPQLAELKQYFPQVDIDDYTMSLSDSFEKWQPKWVVAWTSTGLAIALDKGSLPITLYKPVTQSVWANMIYPMYKRVLYWPNDKCLIDQAMKSQETYYNLLTSFRCYQETDLNLVVN